MTNPASSCRPRACARPVASNTICGRTLVGRNRRSCLSATRPTERSVGRSWRAILWFASTAANGRSRRISGGSTDSRGTRTDPRLLRWIGNSAAPSPARVPDPRRRGGRGELCGRGHAAVRMARIDPPIPRNGRFGAGSELLNPRSHVAAPPPNFACSRPIDARATRIDWGRLSSGAVF